MNALLSPLVALLNRLAYPLKFALVAGMACLVMSILVFLSGKSEYAAWQTAVNEQCGLDVFESTQNLPDELMGAVSGFKVRNQR